MCAIQPMKKIFKHESLKNETLVSATGVFPAHTNYLKNICLKTQIIYYSALGCYSFRHDRTSQIVQLNTKIL